MVKENTRTLNHDALRKNERKEWKPKLERRAETGGNLSYIGRVYFKDYNSLNRRLNRGKGGMSKDKSHSSPITQCLKILSGSWKSIIAKENPHSELL